jgi:ATP-binding cassette subfamily C (CFTR/MRP) protein 4
VIGLGVSVIVLALIRSFATFALTMKASRLLHDRMTLSVLRAQIEFFDTNPLGRIMNRFSADVGSNDDLLPQTLFDFLMTAFLVVGKYHLYINQDYRIFLCIRF